MSDAPPTAKPTRTKRTTVFDYEAATVTLDNLNYSARQMPVAAALHFQLDGFARWLLQQDDPRHAATLLALGETDVTRAAKSTAGKLDNWRLAGAYAIADHHARAAGVKALPSKKLHDAPAYAPHLDAAKVEVAGWDRKQRDLAKTRVPVVDHYNRLTCSAGGLDGLIAPAASLAEAAD